MKILQGIRALPGTAFRALARTPLEVLIASTAWITLAIAIEYSWVLNDWWSRVAVSASIALPLVYATSILHATDSIRRGTRWLAASLITLTAALYGWLGYDPALGSEGVRGVTLIIVSVLALLTVPLLTRGPAGQTLGSGNRSRVHLFTTRFSARVAIVIGYCLALLAGLAAALGAINGLFELDLPGRIYGHLAAFIFVLVGPWAVAAGLPDLIAPQRPWSGTVLRAIRRTGLYLLAPLIVTYLLIVYAYTVRMIVTGKVPSNLISPVVLGAGILTIAATFLLEPLHEYDGSRGLLRLLRTLPVLLVPLSGLAFWAIAIRIGEYGWTEARYLRLLGVVLLGAFSVAGTIRLGLRRLPPLTTLPAVAAAALLISTIGPLSAPATAFRSQMTRLASIIPPPTERSIEQPVTISDTIFDQVIDQARYIDRQFGWDALAPLLPVGTERPEPVSRVKIADALGLIRGESDQWFTRLVTATLPRDAATPGIQGGTLYLVAYYTKSGAASRDNPIDAQVDSASTRLEIRSRDGDQLSADLGPLIGELRELTQKDPGEPVQYYEYTGGERERIAYSNHASLSPATALITLRDHLGNPGGQILINEIVVTLTGDQASIKRWEGIVLLAP